MMKELYLLLITSVTLLSCSSTPKTEESVRIVEPVSNDTVIQPEIADEEVVTETPSENEQNGSEKNKKPFTLNPITGFNAALYRRNIALCQRNQREIATAIYLYMIDNDIETLSETPFAGVPVTDPLFQAALVGDSTYLEVVPECPAGGSYFVRPVDKDVDPLQCNNTDTNGKLNHPIRLIE